MKLNLLLLFNHFGALSGRVSKHPRVGEPIYQVPLKQSVHMYVSWFLRKQLWISVTVRIVLREYGAIPSCWNVMYPPMSQCMLQNLGGKFWIDAHTQEARFFSTTFSFLTYRWVHDEHLSKKTICRFVSNGIKQLSRRKLLAPVQRAWHGGVVSHLIITR